MRKLIYISTFAFAVAILASCTKDDVEAPPTSPDAQLIMGVEGDDSYNKNFDRRIYRDGSGGPLNLDGDAGVNDDGDDESGNSNSSNVKAKN